MDEQRTETQTGTAKPCKKCRTPARRVLRVLLVGFALCAILVSGAGLFLVHRPEVLGLSATLTERISALTGLDCRAGGPVELGIFPTPYIQVYRLSLFAPRENSAPPAAAAPAPAVATLPNSGPVSMPGAQNASIPNAQALADPDGNATIGVGALYQVAEAPLNAGGGAATRPILSVAAVRVELRALPLFTGQIVLRQIKLFDPIFDLDAFSAMRAGQKQGPAPEAAMGATMGAAAAAGGATLANATAPAPATLANATAPANATTPASAASGPASAVNATAPALANATAPAAQSGAVLAEAPFDAAALLQVLPEVELNGGVVLKGEGATDRRVLARSINLRLEDGDLRLSLLSHALAEPGGRLSSLDVRLNNLSAVDGEIRAELRLEAELNILGQTLQPKLASNLAYNPARQRLGVTDFSLDLEKLHIGGQFAANLTAGGFQVVGRLEHEHLSLPRWFQFGRNLPGSLQYALDDLSGAMSFDLNQDRLEVSQMVTHVLGMTLTGTGGTPDFAAPDVVIDAHGPFLDVNTIFPEVLDPAPDPLPRVHYEQLPLVGGGNVDNSDLPDVGHDITINGDKAQVRKLKVDNLSVRIVPSPRGTQCLFDLGHVAGGTMTAALTVLEDDKEDRIEIDSKLENLSIQTLGEDLFDRAPLVTSVGGTAKIRAIPDTLSVFFRSMDVDFALKFGAGSLFLRETKRKLTFDSVVALGQGASKPGQDGSNAMLTFVGDWNFQAAAGKEKLKAALKGPLGVDEQSLDLTVPGGDITATANVDMAFLGLDSAHEAKFAGRLDYDDRARTLFLRKASFSLPYGTGSGDISCREQGFPAEAWSGAIKLDVPSIRDWLGYMGFAKDDLPEQGLNKGVFGFKFEQSGQKWAIKDADILLDDKVKGGLTLSQAGDKSYAFNLRLESINMDDYYPPRTTSSALPSPQPWDLSGLMKTRVKGDVYIKDMIWRKLHYTDVTTPLSLENGKVRIPATAGFYGGQNVAELNATIEPNRINASFSLDFKGAQLEGITKALYADERAAGPINVSLLANGSPTRASEILTAFSGQWAFDVGSGHFRGKRDEATGKEPSKTKFSSIRSSGRLHDGRLETDNFTLTAPGSTDTVGHGYVDIAKDAIDMDFEVRMLGITVPVRLHGSLEAPETTVKSGKLIGNAVGGIGSGLFGLVVDVITLPGKVIMLPFGKEQNDGGTSGNGGAGGAGNGGAGGGSGNGNAGNGGQKQ